MALAVALESLVPGAPSTANRMVRLSRSRLTSHRLKSSSSGTQPEVRMKLPNTIFICACLLLASGQARAGAPHLTVLGIPLGEKFAVPPCKSSEVTVSSRLCFNPAMVERSPSGAEQYYVSLPNAGTPHYVRGEVTVQVVEGSVGSITIGTWGIEGQAPALADLKRQYGPPARERQEMKHRRHSRFPSEFAEWDVGDVLVKFDGTAGSVDWGKIEVSTRRYRDFVAAHGAGADRR
jgi:hypothetical protein